MCQHRIGEKSRMAGLAGSLYLAVTGALGDLVQVVQQSLLLLLEQLLPVGVEVRPDGLVVEGTQVHTTHLHGMRPAGSRHRKLGQHESLVARTASLGCNGGREGRGTCVGRTDLGIEAKQVEVYEREDCRTATPALAANLTFSISTAKMIWAGQRTSHLDKKLDMRKMRVGQCQAKTLPIPST